MSETPAPPDASSPLARLEALARRELGAVDLRVLPVGATTVEAPNVLFASLPDGRRVVVTFPDAPDDREAIGRRLGMLVHTFAQTIEQGEPERVRAPAVSSLHDELRALATRAQASDALVLDAHSPVVWGASSRPRPFAGLTRTPELDEALRQVELSRRQLAPLDSDLALHENDEAANDDDAPPPLPEVSQRAMRETRALPGLDALRRGGQLHHSVRGADFGYSAHSFAGIYLLVLVFEEPFDELRAERAVIDGLPRIERLVLALPPLDPTPEPRGNVISMRRRGRR